MKKLLLGLALLAGTAASAGGLLINGAGATFPVPALFEVVQPSTTSCTPTSSSTTSRSARAAASSRSPRSTVDFGASDAPMTDDELAEGAGRGSHPDGARRGRRRLQRRARGR